VASDDFQKRKPLTIQEGTALERQRQELGPSLP
jgi:hypothetical protein